MNQNYIAPEALDDNNKPVCPHCKKAFLNVDDKIRFYQGDCPHCGMNPSALSVVNSKRDQKEESLNPYRSTWSTYTTHYTFRPIHSRTLTPSEQDDANSLQQLALGDELMPPMPPTD